MADEDSSRFAAACDKAEKVALRLIGRAEQNSLGLTAKLEKKGFEAAVAREVVSRLQSRNLLDDTRYAELWIHSRLSGCKKLTPLSLLRSLNKKGIDMRLSKNALEKALDPDTEYSMLENYLKKANIIQHEKIRILKAQLKKEGFSSEVLERFYS